MFMFSAGRAWPVALGVQCKFDWVLRILTLRAFNYLSPLISAHDSVYGKDNLQVRG